MRRKDPVVEEIRAIRRQLWERAGGSADAVAELIQRDEELQKRIGRKWKERGS